MHASASGLTQREQGTEFPAQVAQALEELVGSIEGPSAPASAVLLSQEM